MKLFSRILALVAWICLSVSSSAQDQAKENPASGAQDGSHLKIEMVCETKKGSGQYEVLDAAPLFPADSGVGRGEPRFMTMSNPKGIFLYLQAALDPSKIGIIDADIGGPKAHFKGNLTETSANSGIFTDAKKTVTLKLPVGTTTLGKKTDVIPVSITSDVLGFEDTLFSLYYWASHTPSKGSLSSPFNKVEIQFPKSYDPKIVNHLLATMSMEVSL